MKAEDISYRETTDAPFKVKVRNLLLFDIERRRHLKNIVPRCKRSCAVECEESTSEGEEEREKKQGKGIGEDIYRRRKEDCERYGAVHVVSLLCRRKRRSVRD